MYRSFNKRYIKRGNPAKSSFPAFNDKTMNMIAIDCYAMVGCKSQTRHLSPFCAKSRAPRHRHLQISPRAGQSR